MTFEPYPVGSTASKVIAAQIDHHSPQIGWQVMRLAEIAEAAKHSKEGILSYVSSHFGIPYHYRGQAEGARRIDLVDRCHPGQSPCPGIRRLRVHMSATCHARFYHWPTRFGFLTRT